MVMRECTRRDRLTVPLDSPTAKLNGSNLTAIRKVIVPIDPHRSGFLDDGGSCGGRAELSVVTVQHGELAVLFVTGTVDLSTASHLSTAVDEVATQPPAGVVIDLSGTDFLASVGMAALIDAHDAITPHAAFAVVAHGPATARPLQLMGLDQVFTLYPTLDDALGDLG